MEEAAAGAQLLQLHGLRAGGQRRGEPQRGPDRDEQHGPLARAPARLLVLRMTGVRRAHLTAPARSDATDGTAHPFIVLAIDVSVPSM